MSGESNYLRRAIEALSRRLQASLGATSPLSDSLSKGELREEAVVEAFRPHVPTRYDLIKGVIVNSSGEESDPQDVVLLDSAFLPAILGTRQNRIVPVEGVVGSIQLKSIATTQAIESGVANIASAKRLVPAGVRYGLPRSSPLPYVQGTGASFFGGLLCLRRDRSIQSLLDCYADCVMDLPLRDRCDALCIVDEVSVLWGEPSKGEGIHFAWRGEQAEVPLAIHAEADTTSAIHA